MKIKKCVLVDITDIVYNFEFGNPDHEYIVNPDPREFSMYAHLKRKEIYVYKKNWIEPNYFPYYESYVTLSNHSISDDQAQKVLTAVNEGKPSEEQLTLGQINKKRFVTMMFSNFSNDRLMLVVKDDTVSTTFVAMKRSGENCNLQFSFNAEIETGTNWVKLDFGGKTDDHKRERFCVAIITDVSPDTPKSRLKVDVHPSYELQDSSETKEQECYPRRMFEGVKDDEELIFDDKWIGSSINSYKCFHYNDDTNRGNRWCPYDPASLPKIMKKIRNKQKETVFERSVDTRDWIPAEDFCCSCGKCSTSDAGLFLVIKLKATKIGRRQLTTEDMLDELSNAVSEFDNLKQMIDEEGRETELQLSSRRRLCTLVNNGEDGGYGYGYGSGYGYGEYDESDIDETVDDFGLGFDDIDCDEQCKTELSNSDEDLFGFIDECETPETFFIYSAALDSNNADKCKTFFEFSKLHSTTNVEQYTSFCHKFDEDKKKVWVLGAEGQDCVGTCNALGMTTIEYEVPKTKYEFMNIEVEYKFINNLEAIKLDPPQSVTEMCQGSISSKKTWSNPEFDSEGRCSWKSRYLHRDADPDQIATEKPEENTSRFCPCLQSTPREGQESLTDSYKSDRRRLVNEFEISAESLQILRKSKKRVLGRKNNARNLGVFTMVFVGLAFSALVGICMTYTYTKKVSSMETEADEQI